MERKAKQVSCEVELWDERLTSYEAEQRIRQQGVAKAKAKAFLDSVAAEVLLEDYLASHPNESE
jgi:putative Holliday junction resolvase